MDTCNWLAPFAQQNQPCLTATGSASEHLGDAEPLRVSIGSRQRVKSARVADQKGCL